MNWTDPESVGVAVRATARLSGAIYMIAITLRALGVPHAWRALVLFIAAHTVHFGMVLLYVATGGRQVPGASGWVAIAAVGLAFYAAAGWLLLRYRRAAPSVSRSETAITLTGWIIFAQAFAMRTSESLAFAPLALAALVALLACARAAFIRPAAF